MPFARPIEHYVTLFNTSYLAAGLSLHRSLCEHAGAFRLWVLCMDTTVETCLRELDLPEVSVIPLSEVETAALVAVKSGRTAGEYCWTLTPFAPEYARHAKAGIYCVQFMTFRNTSEARGVMRWWQDRCIEWCFNRYEDGKIGDQKYLDDWPVRFPRAVHVLRQKGRTLAPWNSAYYLDRVRAQIPVFFHFHGFRVLSDRKMRWYLGFRIGPEAERYYSYYSSEMRSSIALIRERWKVVPTLKDTNSIKEKVARCYHLLTGSAAYRSYSL